MEKGNETLPAVTPSQLIGIAASKCLRRGERVPKDVQALLEVALGTKGRSIASSRSACAEDEKKMRAGK